MVNAIIDAATLKRIYCEYDRMSRQASHSEILMTLHFPVAVGVKSERVLLVPGLLGTVASDDGTVVTVAYYDVHRLIA